MTTVLLPRPAGPDTDVELLERAGCTVVSDPYIEVTPLLDADAMAARRRLAALLPEAALVITSARALAAFIDFCDVDRRTVVYAVGGSSARACEAAGFEDVRVPTDGANNVALVRLIAHRLPPSVVVPRSTAAPDSLLDDLRDLGITVAHATLYATAAVHDAPASLPVLAAGGFDAVIVRSGSAARALAHFVPAWPADTRVIAGGRPTAQVLREHQLPVSALAEQPDSASVVATTLRVLGLGGQHD